MPLLVVIDPADPEKILPLQTVRAHLRVDEGDEDTLIAVYRDAVIRNLDGPEGWLGLVLGRQVLEWRGEQFPCGGDPLDLVFGQGATLLDCSYEGSDRAEASIPAGSLSIAGGYLYGPAGFSWPRASGRPETVRIRFSTPDVEQVHASIRAAMLLMIGDLFRYRNTVAAGAATQLQMSTTVLALLSPLRRFL